MKKIILILLSSLCVFAIELNNISNARLAGQMIFIGFNGKNSNELLVRKLSQEVSLGKVGGIVFTNKNFDSLEQSKKLVTRFKNIAITNQLFLAIDLNGLSSKDDFSYCVEPDLINTELNLRDIENTYLQCNILLRELGINLLLGPRFDYNFKNVDIDKFSIYARDYLSIIKQNKIYPVAKVFPGNYENFSFRNLKPFYDAIQTNKLSFIMLSNKIFKDIDELNISLSSKAISILKDDLEYNGLIMSDDILGGDLDSVKFENRIIDAINAGVDILYFSTSKIKHGDTASYVVDVIVNAVKQGKISRKRLEKSYLKIIKHKEKI